MSGLRVQLRPRARPGFGRRARSLAGLVPVTLLLAMAGLPPAPRATETAPAPGTEGSRNAGPAAPGAHLARLGGEADRPPVTIGAGEAHAPATAPAPASAPREREPVAGPTRPRRETLAGPESADPEDPDAEAARGLITVTPQALSAGTLGPGASASSPQPLPRAATVLAAAIAAETAEMLARAAPPTPGPSLRQGAETGQPGADGPRATDASTSRAAPQDQAPADGRATAPSAPAGQIAAPGPSDASGDLSPSADARDGASDGELNAFPAPDGAGGTGAPGPGAAGTAPAPASRPSGSTPTEAAAAPGAAPSGTRLAALPDPATGGGAEPGGPSPTFRPRGQISPQPDRFVCRDPRLAGTAIPMIGSSGSPCGIPNPVRITQIAGIALDTPATLDCPTARRIAHWLTGVAEPLARAHFGASIAEVDVMGSYVCRRRNHKANAKISEHGKGRALDVGGFRLSDGRRVTVEGDWNRGAGGRFLGALHEQSCGLFMTVLGPEADRYHQDHFHLDTAKRNGTPYCR